MMKDSYLDTQPLAKLKEFGIWKVVHLRRFMMLNLMKLKVPKMRLKTLMILEAFNFQML
jgi:hypothetical protein